MVLLPKDCFSTLGPVFLKGLKPTVSLITREDETLTLGSFSRELMLKEVAELATAAVPDAINPVPNAATVIFLIKSLRCVCMLLC